MKVVLCRESKCYVVLVTAVKKQIEIFCPRQWPTRDDEGYCSTCSYRDAAQLCCNTRLRSTGRHTRSSGAPGWGDDSSLANESTYENQSKELALG